MKRLCNLPTFVILGLLSIYYFAIFLNLTKVLKYISGGTPLIVGYTLMLFLPLGIKTGILVFNKKSKSLKWVAIFSFVIISIFSILLLSKSDLSQWGQKFISSGFLNEFHRTIIGVISTMTIYLFYFIVIQNVKLEEFVENIKALPIVSPVFCFGAPAFWKDSLKGMNLPELEISFLSGISFFAGILFLIGLLIYFVGKNFNIDGDRTSSEAKNVTKNKFLKASLALSFIGITIILFVCLDIAYLIGRI